MLKIRCWFICSLLPHSPVNLPYVYIVYGYCTDKLYSLKLMKNWTELNFTLGFIVYSFIFTFLYGSIIYFDLLSLCKFRCPGLALAAPCWGAPRSASCGSHWLYTPGTTVCLPAVCFCFACTWRRNHSAQVQL